MNSESQENFPLNESGELSDLHLNPSLFKRNLKLVGNNQIIWPPPKILKENLEIQGPPQKYSEKLYANLQNYASEAKTQALLSLRENLISLPSNAYNFLCKASDFTYNSLKSAYSTFFQRKIAPSSHETREKLEENWVFVLHSYKHNDFLEKIRENEENPQFLFTQTNISLGRIGPKARVSSILVETLENSEEIARDFARKSDCFETSFSFVDEVQDFDDLDYAVVLSEAEIQRIFHEYLQANLGNREETAPNLKEIEFLQSNYQRIAVDAYPDL